MSNKRWSKRVELKAWSFVHNNKVDLLEADKGHLHFLVGNSKVYRTPDKNWSCSAGHIVKKKGVWESVGCVIFGNKGTDCSHILAAKIWIKMDK